MVRMPFFTRAYLVTNYASLTSTEGLYMKKIIRPLSYILVAALASCMTLAFLPQQEEQYSKLTELEDIILTQFIGDKDKTAMEDAAAEAMVNSLGDRWSYYLPAAEYASHREQTENAYVGIGVTIQKQEEEPKGLTVISVSKGGSAEAAGILPGDVMVTVEGQSTAELTTTEVRNLVRGEEGTLVSIQILRDGQILDFSVPRRKIETAVAEGQMLDGNIGLIKIFNFDSRCAKEAMEAIQQLREQGAEALIFDVRNNPGGYAAELVKLLDYLLPAGELFSTVDYQGNTHVDKSGPDYLDMPMAVLCNGASYSAAEFFAAAIQEYEAGTVVGTETCGKGYFQYTLQLSDGSAVGLSVGKYFTPKGNSLIGTGIIPDIVVEVDEETEAKIYYGQIEPADDPQLQAAVKALMG